MAGRGGRPTRGLSPHLARWGARPSHRHCDFLRFRRDPQPHCQLFCRCEAATVTRWLRTENMSIEINHLRSWIGREEVAEDMTTTVPVAALAATLDRDHPKPQSGDELPPLWHWLYFLPTVRQSELAPDGHAKRGRFLPPVPLPRRMWAGARFELAVAILRCPSECHPVAQRLECCGGAIDRRLGVMAANK